MVALGVRGGRPVRSQLLRGVGLTVALLTGLIIVATGASWLLDLDGTSALSLPRRIAVAVSWFGILLALTISWRRLRQWSDRPPWLVPAAALIAVVGLVPAVVVRAPVRPSYISHCVPVADAWQPVMAPPSAADFAFLRAHPKPTHVALNVVTRQQREAYTAAFNTWLSAPQYQRVDAYRIWQLFSGPCAKPSRTDLSRSAAGLGVGAAVLAVAVRRRRTATEAQPGS